MEDFNQNQVFNPDGHTLDYLDEQISQLKEILAVGLNLKKEEIKVSFPTLNNFYFVNNVYKSSWAIYINNEKLPKLLFTGNFLIQGDKYGNRSAKSLFGAKGLSGLTSIANTFSTQASFFKQNWTLDLNLFEENENKLKLTVKEYQQFLTLLNRVRSQWLLHFCEEGNFDFVVGEFSEPSDPMLFMDLDSFDALGTKIKTFFKPISEKAISIFKTLSEETEFEGKFANPQPGSWIRDDVLLEMEKINSEKFFAGEVMSNIVREDTEVSIASPFKIQALKPTF